MFLEGSTSHMNTRETYTKTVTQDQDQTEVPEPWHGNATLYATHKHTHYRIKLTFIARRCEVVHKVTKKIIQLCKVETNITTKNDRLIFINNFKASSKCMIINIDLVHHFYYMCVLDFTFIWSCSPVYSMDWKMFQVYLRLISMRLTYWRYQHWIKTAALIASQ